MKREVLATNFDIPYVIVEPDKFSIMYNNNIKNEIFFIPEILRLQYSSTYIIHRGGSYVDKLSVPSSVNVHK